MRGCAVALALLSACSTEVELGPPGLGDAAALVHWTEDGEPRAEVRRGPTFSVAADEGSYVAVFPLPAERLLEVGGGRFAGDPTELRACVGASCGRCGHPSPLEGHVLAPGDACPLAESWPGWRFDASGDCRHGEGCADSTLDREALDATRREVRLQRAGPERPEPARSPSLARLQLRSVDPDPAADRTVFHTRAVAEDGAVAGFGDDVVALTLPTGATWRSRIDPLGGRPRAAVAIDDGFVVAASLPRPWRDERDAYFLFRRDGLGGLLPPEPLPWETEVEARGARRVGNHIYFYGAKRILAVHEPALARCVIGGACTDIALGGCGNTRVGWMEHLEVLDGTALAFAENSVYGGPLDDPNATWACGLVEASHEGSPQPLGRLASVGRFGDRLLACAHAPDEACALGSAMVLTASIADPIHWQTVATGLGGFCGAVLPGATPRVAVGGSVWVSPDATSLADLGPVESALGPAPGATSVVELGPDTAWLGGPFGHGYVWKEGEVRLGLGAPAAPRRTWVGIEAAGDDLWVVAEDGQWRLDPNGRFTALGAAPPSPTLAFAPWQDGLLLVSASGWSSLRADGSAGASSGSLPSGFAVSRAASMGAAGTLLLAEDGRAARIVDGAWEPLEVRLDDPSTPVTEGGPSPDSCGNRPAFWYVLEGTEGGAWAGGPQGLLVRFDATGGVRKTLPTTAALLALRVDSPGRVLAAGYGPVPGAGIEGPYRTQVWSADVGPGWSAVPEERFASIIETSGLASLVFRGPRALLLQERDGASPMMVGDGFVFRFGADDRLVWRRSPFEPNEAVSTPAGAVLARSLHQLAFGVAP